ncbi:hypothetical protein GCK72_022244 [Caenorhabditis remanei]|uniref:Uncharacterized protein n=2 Tax=Caenorhabditis TaxID=6237 RepID=A0A6A5FT88_CAERE|nr:hypothetical protein GCK72_022244 [Caenorhabditis remanei]KAF1745797.1 hypothetical protein GCK72_022244 [Caenorhabditis remanei]
MLYKPNHNHSSAQRKESQHKNSTHRRSSNLGSSRSRCDEAPLASPEQEFLCEKRNILVKLTKKQQKRH